MLREAPATPKRPQEFPGDPVSPLDTSEKPQRPRGPPGTSRRPQEAPGNLIRPFPDSRAFPYG